MPERRLTLMAVHAHPDDEATSTGGVLAQAAARGFRTVLVTCTDGGCGDTPDGVKPDEPGHDAAAVVQLRRGELEANCALLGVTDLELLGYADSGMMGWSTNEAPNAFWNTPVEQAAAKLAGLIEQYRPDVIVTYDAYGFYGHPDHIQAHRITMAAAEATGIASKIYQTTIPRERMAEFGRLMAEHGLEFDLPEGESDPDGEPDPNGEADPDGEPAADGGSGTNPALPPGDSAPQIGLPEAEITTWVDTAAFSDQKYDALAAHASQTENIFFLRMGKELFGQLLGTETFLRVHDTTGAALPEDDLFSGLL